VERSSDRRKRKKGLDLTKPVERPPLPFALLFRMFILGSVAIVASGYAIYRHYYVERPSMLRPVTSSTSQGEEPLPPGFVPVPEIVPVPSSSTPSTPSPSSSH
jgi:hypothetical protein